MREKTVDSQSLPLHYALRYGALPSVARTLLERYPRAAQEADRVGLTPLALALKFGAAEEVVAEVGTKDAS